MNTALLTTLTLSLALLLSAAPSARAVDGAPAFVDYQGTVFDGTADNAPLGSTEITPATTPKTYQAAPKNYTMQFRIYDKQSGSTGETLIWAETQTVTVSLGHFSVRLGLGADIANENPAPTKASIADAFDGTERFLEITVILSGTTGTPIIPRLQFQASPYAFAAQRAKTADEVIGTVTGGAGSKLTGTAQSPVILSGPVTATAAAFTGGTFTGSVGNALTLTGGTYSGNGAGLTNLSGTNLDSNSVDLDKLVAAVKNALCPVGSILAYSGDTAPPGWLLCNGTFYNDTQYPDLANALQDRFGGGAGYFYVPDFRGRFLRGVDGSTGRDPDRFSRPAMQTGGQSGNSVGSVQSDAFQTHSHSYVGPADKRGWPNGSSSTHDGSESWASWWRGNKGNINNVFTTTAGTSSETRPENAYVNFIIKH